MRILPVESLQQTSNHDLQDALNEARAEAARTWAEWERTPAMETLQAWRQLNFYIGDLENEATRRFVLDSKLALARFLGPVRRPMGKAGTVA